MIKMRAATCTLYLGSDQLMRVVDVRVGDKVLKQSVSRISPLEFTNTDSDLRTLHSD